MAEGICMLINFQVIYMYKCFSISQSESCISESSSSPLLFFPCTFPFFTSGEHHVSSMGQGLSSGNLGQALTMLLRYPLHSFSLHSFSQSVLQFVYKAGLHELLQTSISVIEILIYHRMYMLLYVACIVGHFLLQPFIYGLLYVLHEIIYLQ